MSGHSEPKTLDFLLAQVSRLHYARVHQLLEGIGLYRGQPNVLYILWERDGLTHKELAKIMQVTPATVTRMIQRMEKTGFVRRCLDSADQRVSRVYLTNSGREIQTQIKIIWQQMEDEVFAGLTTEERLLLRDFLQKIRINLENAIGEN